MKPSELIEKIREEIKGVTGSGIWWVEDDRDIVAGMPPVSERPDDRLVAECLRKSDANYVVLFSPENVEKLLAEIERLNEEILGLGRIVGEKVIEIKGLKKSVRELTMLNKTKARRIRELENKLREVKP